MDIIDRLRELGPEPFAWQILIFGAGFGIFWYLDHLTHLRIWKKDITDGELRTHRMILYASYGLMGSLVLMRWIPWIVLPLFLGCWVTRTLHEFLDELTWHLPRCTERETLIHLAMWICIHAGTAVTFMWGFFLQFEGIETIHWLFYAGFGALFLTYSYIGHHEIFDYKVKR
ncbi:MAG: hypothetical protein ABL958_18665 [Bdellovibrionia bacterium]